MLGMPSSTKIIKYGYIFDICIYRGKYALILNYSLGTFNILLSLLIFVMAILNRNILSEYSNSSNLYTFFAAEILGGVTLYYTFFFAQNVMPSEELLIKQIIYLTLYPFLSTLWLQGTVMLSLITRMFDKRKVSRKSKKKKTQKMRDDMLDWISRALYRWNQQADPETNIEHDTSSNILKEIPLGTLFIRTSNLISPWRQYSCNIISLERDHRGGVFLDDDEKSDRAWIMIQQNKEGGRNLTFPLNRIELTTTAHVGDGAILITLKSVRGHDLFIECEGQESADNIVSKIKSYSNLRLFT
jgi:hypothetical protein